MCQRTSDAAACGQRIRVGVKFCGNCRPHYDAMTLYHALASAMPGFVFAPWARCDAPQIQLVLNSCPVGCATRPAFGGPVVVVTADSVNAWPTGAKGLLAATRAALLAAAGLAQ